MTSSEAVLRAALVVAKRAGVKVHDYAAPFEAKLRNKRFLEAEIERLPTGSRLSPSATSTPCFLTRNCSVSTSAKSHTANPILWCLMRRAHSTPT